MAATSRWGITPRESVEAECRRRGQDAVVEGCVCLLQGRPAEPELIVALGGPPASWALTGEQGGPDYWLRVWAARGLLWAWDPSAAPALIGAMSDPAWRVREMAAKVAARHLVGDALAAVQALQDDPVARVRAAAERAATRIVAAGA
jgi:HEAT repeat protein